MEIRYEQYERFLSIDNFYYAYKRLQTAPRSLYKQIYISDLRDFGSNLEKNIETVIELVKNKTYEPRNSFKIYTPKPNGLVRPTTVLQFIDLLIYQAIVNIIADEFYDKLKYNYNTLVFGNLYNKTEDEYSKNFFFIPWKKQWKKYESQSRRYFREGYIYLCEFDLASFYDTVDHYLLKSLLEPLINKDIVDLLIRQLNTWSCDYERCNLLSHHGIPQGPNASGLLSEIYLNYIDEKIKYILSKKREIKYLRYVDDIRLFAQDEFTGKKYLAYLDLLSRDLGLIPQGSKIGITKIENEYELIKVQSKKLSQLDNEFKKNGSIKSKAGRKMIKELKESLRSLATGNVSYNKTIIRFGLFRAEKDDEIRDLLINNINFLTSFIDEVCFYLSKHFKTCPKVKEWLNKMLSSDQIIYHYPIAVIFKYFFDLIDYKKEVFERFFKGDDGKNWYIKYDMIKWIYKKNPGKLPYIKRGNNPFVNKLISIYNYYYADKKVKLDLLEEMLSCEDTIISLAAVNLYTYEHQRKWDEISIPENANLFVKRLINKNTDNNYLCNILKKSYKINNASKFFNTSFWSEKELKYACDIFRNSEGLKEIDPSGWLTYIDSFNHLCFIKILRLNKVKFSNPKEYGNLLEKDGFFKDNFSIAYYKFKRIHEKRNETPNAHPFMNDGGLSKLINHREQKKFLKDVEEAYSNICDVFEGLYPKLIREFVAATCE